MRRNLDIESADSFTSLHERLLASHFLVALIGMAVVAAAVAGALYARSATLHLTTEGDLAVQTALRQLVQHDENPTVHRATERLSAISQQQQERVRDEAARLVHVIDAALAILVGLLVAAWVATLVVSMRAANAITRPLAALAGATAALADRTLLDDLPVEREDEVGVLTRAFNHMRASVVAAERALTARAAEATAAHAALEAEFRERTQVEAMFRQLLEATPDAILIVDQQGGIVLANPASERLFGYPRHELLGGALATVLPALEWTQALTGSGADARRVAAEPEPHAVRKDGGTVPVEIRANPFVVDEQTLLAVAVRDVTERHRAAQALRELNADLEQRVLGRTAELRRSNEELERFASIASHDLQEPLRMVASYTRLLGDRYRGRLDADADEFIGYVSDGVHRMQRLIRDLLAYARVSSRAREPEPTDAGAILERTLANLQLAISESGAVVMSDPLPWVRVDASQLGQLLQNLVDNALKFGADRPPRVHVGAERTPEGWMFSVRDNGIGIAAHDVQRVFALFERVQREHPLPGSGIGLALCKKIVERHGGRIWMEGGDEGAVVRFTLPAAAQDEARPASRDRRASRAVSGDQRAARSAGARA